MCPNTTHLYLVEIDLGHADNYEEVEPGERYHNFFGQIANLKHLKYLWLHQNSIV